MHVAPTEEAGKRFRQYWSALGRSRAARGDRVSVPGHTIFWEHPVSGARALYYNVIHRDDAMTATIQPPALAFAWRAAVGDPALEPRIVAHHAAIRSPSASRESPWITFVCTSLIRYGVAANAAIAAVLLHQAIGLLVPLTGGWIAYAILRHRFGPIRANAAQHPTPGS